MEKPSKEKVKLVAIISISLTVLFFAIIIVLLTSCSLLKNYPADNVVEEVAEEVVKHYTGADIDFTPGSPEKH